MKYFAVSVLVIFGVIFSSASAQNPNRPPAFDVVSIHPSKGNAAQGFRITPDGYSANNQPLFQTILMAYFPFQLWSNDRIKGAPSWVVNEPYDFMGKVAPDDLPQWQKYGID